MHERANQLAYSVSQAAAVSGFSRFVLYERINGGELPAYKSSPKGDLRILHADLMAWITRIQVTPKTKEEPQALRSSA